MRMIVATVALFMCEQSHLNEMIGSNTAPDVEYLHNAHCQDQSHLDFCPQLKIQLPDDKDGNDCACPVRGDTHRAEKPCDVGQDDGRSTCAVRLPRGAEGLASCHISHHANESAHPCQEDDTVHEPGQDTFGVAHDSKEQYTDGGFY